MQKNAYPFCGSIVHEDDVPNNQVSYRFHLTDPVRFNKRIKVCLESGHADHLRDDWSTTAYWYQTLPGPKLSLPPVEQRCPRKATIPRDDVPEPDITKMTEPQQAAVKSRPLEYHVTCYACRVPLHSSETFLLIFITQYSAKGHRYSVVDKHEWRAI